MMEETHYRTRTFSNIALAGIWEKEKGAAKCAAPNSPVLLFGSLPCCSLDFVHHVLRKCSFAELHNEWSVLHGYAFDLLFMVKLTSNRRRTERPTERQHTCTATTTDFSLLNTPPGKSVHFRSRQPSDPLDGVQQTQRHKQHTPPRDAVPQQHLEHAFPFT